MTRETLRLLLRTIASWRRRSTPEEPGSDDQRPAFPHRLNRFNDSAKADQEEGRWRP